LQMQADRRAAYLSTLNTIISVFGAETRIGKAALLAKQAYAIAETIINIAKGTGKTAASVPFPLNIPLIIGFVAQVAGLIGTIKGATGKVKGYATGGFTNGAEMYVAGEKGTEWIAPNWMTKDKVTAPIISGLEHYRKQHVHPNLLSIVTSLPFFEKGGYTDMDLNAKIGKLNNTNYFFDPTGIIGAKVDKLQNEVLSGLVKRVSKSLDENTAATNRLMKWQPTLAVDTFEKRRNQHNDIEKNSGL